MKYIRTFENFKYEPVNEEIFGIGKFFKNMWSKLAGIKGAKELENKYNEWKKKIAEEIKKKANIELNLFASSSLKESLIVEADEIQDGDTKIDAETLKEKKKLIDQIIDSYFKMAMKDFDRILVKFGGEEKNPQLKLLIDTKKDQFNLDVLNAKIKALEDAGDKSVLPQVIKARDTANKQLQAKLNNVLTTKKEVKYEVGDEVIYLRKDKTKDDWNKLSDDEKRKIAKDKKDDSETVAVKSIEEIDGDEYGFGKTDDGKADIKKKKSEIIAKVSEIK
jgi:hypothetical protein